MSKLKKNHVIFTHITIGLQLAITVLIFVYGGYRLDEYYNKSPLFVGIGALIGMALGFYHLLKELSSENLKEKQSDEAEKKKIKWM